MFDPQMLMSLLGGMNGNNSNNQTNNFATNQDGNSGGFDANMLSGLMQNPSMLTGLMQMMNGQNNNSQNAPQTGKNTYVDSKAANTDINKELYRILKDAENI